MTMLYENILQDKSVSMHAATDDRRRKILLIFNVID